MPVPNCTKNTAWCYWSDCCWADDKMTQVESMYKGPQFSCFVCQGRSTSSYGSIASHNIITATLPVYVATFVKPLFVCVHFDFLLIAVLRQCLFPAPLTNTDGLCFYFVSNDKWKSLHPYNFKTYSPPTIIVECYCNALWLDPYP